MTKGGGSGGVLITGASAGIGLELAKAFAQRGRPLILLARSRERLTEIARELTATQGVQVTILPADLSLPGAGEAAFDALRRDGIAVDILVNNAGVICEGDFARLPLEDPLRLLQINVVALTALTRLFLPPMLERRSGRILNVASIAAFAPVPRIAVYAAAKAYVLSFTEALSEELRDSGVTATALCPGFTDTAMLRGSKLGRPLPSHRHHVRGRGRQTRLRRVPGGRGDMRARTRQCDRDERRPVSSAQAGARHRRMDQRRRLATARGHVEGNSAAGRARRQETEVSAMARVRANGIEIEYQESGPPDAEAILLIMGLGMQLVAWPDEFCDVPGGARFSRHPLRQSRRRPFDPDAQHKLPSDRRPDGRRLCRAAGPGRPMACATWPMTRLDCSTRSA